MRIKFFLLCILVAFIMAGCASSDSLSSSEESTPLKSIIKSASVVGIRSYYEKSEKVYYVAKAEIESALRLKATFVVTSDSDLETKHTTSWEIGNSSMSKSYYFSTLGWQEGSYSYKVSVKDSSGKEVVSSVKKFKITQDTTIVESKIKSLIIPVKDDPNKLEFEFDLKYLSQNSIVKLTATVIDSKGKIVVAEKNLLEDELKAKSFSDEDSNEARRDSSNSSKSLVKKYSVDTLGFPAGQYSLKLLMQKKNSTEAIELKKEFTVDEGITEGYITVNSEYAVGDNITIGLKLKNSNWRLKKGSVIVKDSHGSIFFGGPIHIYIAPSSDNLNARNSVNLNIYKQFSFNSGAPYLFNTGVCTVELIIETTGGEIKKVTKNFNLVAGENSGSITINSEYQKGETILYTVEGKNSKSLLKSMMFTLGNSSGVKYKKRWDVKGFSSKKSSVNITNTNDFNKGEYNYSLYVEDITGRETLVAKGKLDIVLGKTNANIIGMSSTYPVKGEIKFNVEATSVGGLKTVLLSVKDSDGNKQESKKWSWTTFDHKTNFQEEIVLDASDINSWSPQNYICTITAIPYEGEEITITKNFNITAGVNSSSVTINSHYTKGEIVSYRVKGENSVNRLKKMVFIIETSNVQKYREEWDSSGSSIEKSFDIVESKNWSEGIYNYSLYVEDITGRKREEKGTFKINLMDISIDGIASYYGVKERILVAISAGNMGGLKSITFNIKDSDGNNKDSKNWQLTKAQTNFRHLFYIDTSNINNWYPGDYSCILVVTPQEGDSVTITKNFNLSGGINGGSVTINSNFIRGDTISYKVCGTNSRKNLKRMVFIIKDASGQKYREEWSVEDGISTQTSSISESNSWSQGDYTYLLSVEDITGNKKDISGTFKINFAPTSSNLNVSSNYNLRDKVLIAAVASNSSGLKKAELVIKDALGNIKEKFDRTISATSFEETFTLDTQNITYWPCGIYTSELTIIPKEGASRVLSKKFKLSVGTTESFMNREIQGFYNYEDNITFNLIAKSTTRAIKKMELVIRNSGERVSGQKWTNLEGASPISKSYVFNIKSGAKYSPNFQYDFTVTDASGSIKKISNTFSIDTGEYSISPAPVSNVDSYFTRKLTRKIELPLFIYNTKGLIKEIEVKFSVDNFGSDSYLTKSYTEDSTVRPYRGDYKKLSEIKGYETIYLKPEFQLQNPQDGTYTTLGFRNYIVTIKNVIPGVQDYTKEFYIELEPDIDFKFYKGSNAVKSGLQTASFKVTKDAILSFKIKALSDGQIKTLRVEIYDEAGRNRYDRTFDCKTYCVGDEPFHCNIGAGDRQLHYSFNDKYFEISTAGWECAPDDSLKLGRIRAFVTGEGGYQKLKEVKFDQYSCFKDKTEYINLFDPRQWPIQ